MRKTVFQWKNGARIKADPEEAVKALEAIRDRKGGNYQPEDVVTAAKPKRHPLHDEFEWDDAMAAHAHRVQHARYIIRSLEVTISEVDAKDKVTRSVTLRKYTSLGSGSEDGEDSRFHETQEMLSDAELKKQVLLKVWRQLLNLKRQYEDYQEFADVWAAVEKVQQQQMAAIG